MTAVQGWEDVLTEDELLDIELLEATDLHGLSRLDVIDNGWWP